MTPLQQKQFNTMRAILIRISKHYMTPEQIRRNSEKSFGLGYEEALEMSYENVKSEASSAVKGVKEFKPKTKSATP